ncbi:uncharacterized protein LOC125038403 [Penaeus chinensis]|uniref:uncharacterized protein LOC125038403 n=1 Tax=Penaeus chinensis TaxID=139456 RepID=UPI001FB8581E|nr:uncharacterized protein LOC125038403 [Penaeus chinensis]
MRKTRTNKTKEVGSPYSCTAGLHAPCAVRKFQCNQNESDARRPSPLRRRESANKNGQDKCKKRSTQMRLRPDFLTEALVTRPAGAVGGGGIPREANHKDNSSKPRPPASS